MTRGVAVARLIPIVRRSLVLARADVLAECGPMARRIVAPAYDLIVRFATPLLTRIAVECSAEILRPHAMPMLDDAREFFDHSPAQPLHPAVSAALRESHSHDAPLAPG